MVPHPIIKEEFIKMNEVSAGSGGAQPEIPVFIPRRRRYVFIETSDDFPQAAAKEGAGIDEVSSQ